MFLNDRTFTENTGLNSYPEILDIAAQPDGETILVGSAEDGEKKFRVLHRNDNRRHPVYSSNGKYFIYTGNNFLIIRDISNYTIVVWKADDGSILAHADRSTLQAERIFLRHLLDRVLSRRRTDRDGAR